MEEVFNWQAVAATFTAQGVEFGGSRPKETGPERRTPEIFRRHSLSSPLKNGDFSKRGG